MSKPNTPEPNTPEPNTEMYRRCAKALCACAQLDPDVPESVMVQLIHEHWPASPEALASFLKALNTKSAPKKAIRTAKESSE